MFGLHFSWHEMVMGPLVILILKIAVAAATVVFLTAMAALARGSYLWHGRFNKMFFALTLSAILSLEVLVRYVDPNVFDYFDEDARQHLRTHLYFALPAAGLLPVMLYSGVSHRRYVHIALGVMFSILWAGTFITGVFFLPHWK